MKKFNDIIKPSDFMSARAEYEFTVTNANTSGHTKCSKDSFEDVNPLPGEKKHCFCDQNSSTMTVDQIIEIKEYWRSQSEFMKIQENRVNVEYNYVYEHQHINMIHHK